MRLLIGAGTPREAAARAPAYLFFIYTEDAVAIILVAASRDGFAILERNPLKPEHNLS
jgi:hypothetical protein